MAAGVGVDVGVNEAVLVALTVGVAVRVAVGVRVAVAVALGVTVGVTVGVAVGMTVGVGVAVGVALAVGVGDGVSVRLGQPGRFSGHPAHAKRKVSDARALVEVATIARTTRPRVNITVSDCAKAAPNFVRCRVK
jgi:hypothetical protein